MNPFSSLTTDVVFIVKPDGARSGPYKAALTSKSCTIFDKTLDVDHGDVIARPLPNNKEEHYTILSADFREDFGGIPGGYDLKLEKHQQLHRPTAATVNHVSITNSSGFQVGNNNVQNIQAALVSLEQAIQSANASAESKEEAKSKLKAFLEHPLVAAILGGAAGGLVG